jgi:hypothetical protein
MSEIKGIDLHGVTLNDLPKKLDVIMRRCLENGMEEIEFITGEGPLQEELMDLCLNAYGCFVRKKLGNNGVLVVDLT